MMKRRFMYSALLLVSALASGCSVDYNLATSNAIQSVALSAWGNLVAGLVNSVLVVPG